MSTYDAMAPMAMNDDAAFRSWGTSFHALLTAVGLVQTADTGQVNWTTVTRPTTNTDGGYSVWRFDDALQATVPIFIKFYFGTGDSSGRPRWRFEIGSASDGAGTLSGLGSGTISTVTNNVTVSASTPYRWMGAGDGSGWWGAFGGVDNSTVGIRTFFVIDRFRNDDGTPNGDGFTVMYRNAQNSLVYTEIHDRATSTRSTLSYAPILVPYPVTAGVTTLTADGELVTYPAWVATPKPRGIKMLRGYHYADLGAFQRFTTTTFGAARTFMGTGWFQSYWDSAVRSQITAAVWWAD